MKEKLALTVTLLSLIMLQGNAQEQPYFFVLLTDTQFGMYSANRDFTQETANFEFAVAAANRLKPGFVIVLGDLVNQPGEGAQIGEYLRISRKIGATVPLYNVAGNHDIGNEPTLESIAAYRKTIGRDYYSFRAGPVYGIILNSTLIHSPRNAPEEYRQQDAWLREELQRAKTSGSKQIIVFQHHPLFLKSADESDRYENIPLERRRPLLDLFRSSDVRHVFAGHTHQNISAREGLMEIVATGPVGKPLGKDGSGIRIARVTASGVEHRYFDFGKLPATLAASLTPD